MDENAYRSPQETGKQQRRRVYHHRPASGCLMILFIFAVIAVLYSVWFVYALVELPRYPVVPMSDLLYRKEITFPDGYEREPVESTQAESERRRDRIRRWTGERVFVVCALAVLVVIAMVGLYWLAMMAAW